MRHVTLRQLRTFTTALRAGSFSAAAEALHITPPAVTVQMRQLETIAGMPLIERTSDGLKPTDAGREIAGAALRIEATLAECDDALASLRGLDSGRVAVGVVSTAKYFAPQVLGAFARAHPGVEIRLEVGNRAAILGALEANTLDLALTGWPPRKLAVQKAPIGSHPHIIVARPDHVHANERHVGAAALAQETFLVREPGSGTRLLMERLFADARVKPRIGMEMGSNETIKQAVIAGLGIAFISAHTVAVELADGRLVALDVAGLPVMRTWYIVNLAKKRLLPSAAALRQFMIDEGHAFLPPFPALAAAPAHARPARTKRKSRARAETGRRRLKMSARYPKIEILDFEAGARAARGVAVVIDVFRAFSVACYAFANGAERIIPVADIEDARRLKIENPGFISLGERHARKLEGFDFGNSPTHIEHVDFRGRTLVHTTHAGTQGLVNATHCEVVITGSLVNAAAICRYIAHLAPREVSLVRMGQDARERCAEDDLCAEMLAMRLRGEHFDTDTIRARLRAAPSAQKFFDPEATWAPERDFELCTDADRFDFVLRLRPAAVGPAQLQALAT